MRKLNEVRKCNEKNMPKCWPKSLNLMMLRTLHILWNWAKCTETRTSIMRGQNELEKSKNRKNAQVPAKNVKPDDAQNVTHPLESGQMH